MTQRKPIQEHSWGRVFSATILAILLIGGCTVAFPAVDPSSRGLEGVLFFLGIVWLITAFLAINTRLPSWALGLIGLVSAALAGFGLVVEFRRDDDFAWRFAIGWSLVTLLQWALCRATVWLRPEVRQNRVTDEVERESS